MLLFGQTNDFGNLFEYKNNVNKNLFFHNRIEVLFETSSRLV